MPVYIDLTLHILINGVLYYEQLTRDFSETLETPSKGPLPSYFTLHSGLIIACRAM